MGRTLLITGASGLVGRAVVNRAVAAGWSVRALTHSPDKVDSLKRRGCAEVFIGDVVSGEGLPEAAAGADAMLHSVGALVEGKGSTYDTVNVGGTRNAIEAAKEAGVRKFVMMSALGLEGARGNRYADSKLECERLLLSSGLDYTALRCSYVVGAHAPVLGIFKQLAGLPIVPIIGRGTQLMQMVWVGDVAHCLVAALDAPEAKESIFELCGPAPLTYDEVIDVVARTLGRRPPLKVHFPYGLVRLALPLAEMMPGSVVSRTTIDMLMQDSVCDPRRSSQVFGVEPRPLEKALRDAYDEELKSNGS